MSDKDALAIAAGVIDRVERDARAAGTPAIPPPPAAPQPVAPEPPAPTDASNPLQVMARLAEAFKTGDPSSDPALQEDVHSHVHGLEKRAELMSSLAQAHEFERLLRLTVAADGIERQLIEASKRTDLDTIEKLALFHLLSRERDSVTKRTQSNAVDIKDIAGLFMKVDATMQRTNEKVMKRFVATSPQGREIVRRTVSTLMRAKRGADSTEVADG